MATEIGSQFSMNAALPLDDRSTMPTIGDRDAIAAGVRYEGMIVYVESARTNYQLIGGLTNFDWTELSGSGSGGPDGSTSTAKTLLVNNSVNTISEIGDYLAECPSMIIEYYLYRRTDSAVVRMSGVIRLETVPEEVLSADRWKLTEASRSEYGGDSGVTFSLTETDVEKSVLVATLNNMSGASHVCKFYYKITRFNNDTGKIIILDNNSINPISSIGEYLVDAGGVIIDYFIYRRTDAAFKTLSGKIFIEGNEDGVTNPDKWQIFEAERSENLGNSGVSFSLDDVDTEKSILVVTLDNMAGSDHRCDF